MSGPRILIGDPSGELVRRKIVVFKRLEPGDSPSVGSHPLKESPYLEGRVVEIALGKDIHDDMVRLEKRRIEVLRDTVSLSTKYDVPGMLIAAGGGGLVGAFFDFLPLHLVPYLGGIFGLGVLLGFVTRIRKRGGEIAAEERWKAMPEQKEYDSLARDLADAWITFANDIKAEIGSHVELRVAEGSDDPLRIASIDPRGFIAVPPTFDPEDFLPTEGAGVRYEVVHAIGAVVTRLLEGVKDSPMSGTAEPKPKTTSEPKTESDTPLPLPLADAPRDTRRGGEGRGEGASTPPAAKIESEIKSESESEIEGEVKSESEGEKANAP